MSRRDPVMELARRRRGGQHTHTREVRAEHLPAEVMALMERMTAEIGTLKARLARFESALIKTCEEHAIREPQL